MKHIKKRFLLGSIAIASSGSFTSAFAQQAQSDGEIIVTAQRRDQNIQDVGIAIAAYSGNALREMGVGSSVDIARLTPGVSISASAGGQNSQFSIRGVTQNDFSDAIEAPVAVYVDETYIPNLNGQIFGTFDLDRVEVLKGPQGTLFGRNATGGLVHFVPKKPGDEPDGYLDMTYGRFNHVRVEGAIGIPLSEKVQFRLSGLYNRFDPILKNIYSAGLGTPLGSTPPRPDYGEDLWNDDTLAVRGQIQFKPTEDLTIRLTGSVARTRFGENPYNAVSTIAVYDDQQRLVNVLFADANETRIAIGPNGENVALGGLPTTATRPSPGGDLFGFVAPSARSLNISKDWALDDLNHMTSYDSALHIAYDFGGAELVAISNYRRFDKFNGTDVDAGAENLINFISDSLQKSFSQEVRLSGGREGLRWVTGAYYLHINSHVNNGFAAPSNSIFAASFPGFEASGIDLVNDIVLKTNSYSAFANVEYEFVPQWTFVLGGRLIHEKQNYAFSSLAYNNVNDYAFDITGSPLFPLQTPFSDRRSKTMWAGKAQIEYRPNRDTLLYFGVNRGVKGGAYNAALPDGTVLTPGQIPYKPETLMSYEGGFKLTLAQNRLTLNGSVYYYDYRDYQAFTFANVSGIVSNNDARTYGAELSLNARPIEGMHLGLGISVLDAKVKDMSIAPGLTRDVKPTFTPTTQVAGQIAYTIPADVGGGAVSIGGDASWRSKVYGNIRNFDADTIKSYFLANAHIYWLSDDSHYRIGVGVDNIFDKRYRTVTYNLATLCGCNEESYGTPRWWNLKFAYTY
ncbi:TonB-dependent receptor [Sphingobium terrigena]|uniref:TonB-dependent receptor n=1 Tax=Sphingobium terrigena TaxID=2304063 RepID=A0A418YUR9_9SPHN|nr:TonB-dependent receptor [Sphingobium terrigena]RJG55890.1 TonB-dependent receptor [Sphingobium terrigena]